MLSRTACVIYLLICLAALSALFYLLELRRKGERARQYAKLVNNKEKEIYNAKINFFTNITHEIRTPLTLIKMPLDKIIASKRYTPESEKDLRTSLRPTIQKTEPVMLLLKSSPPDLQIQHGELGGQPRSVNTSS